jgi:hypothetical protein
MGVARATGRLQCMWHTYWWFLVVTVTYLCSLSSLATTVTTTSVCPADRPQSSAAVAATVNNQFFLNIDHPVECNGTVVGWKMCYYYQASGFNDEEEIPFAVTLGVWRISSSGSRYWLVGYKAVEKLGMDLQDGFNCVVITYSAAEQFGVKPGDLVGFHTHNVDPPKEVLELRAMTSTGEQLAKRMDSGFCQYSYPGFPVSVSCFENVTGAMHVHVMVEELGKIIII